MKKAAIFTDLIGYETIGRKTAVLTSQAQDFTLNDINGNSVFAGKVTHFGMDKLSGDDVYIADFSGFEDEGEYYITPALRRSGSELLPAFRESVLSGLRKTVAGLSGGDEEKYRHYKAILEELTDDDCS